MPAIWYPKEAPGKTKPLQGSAGSPAEFRQARCITSGPPFRRRYSNAKYRLAKASRVWDVQARAVSGGPPQGNSQVQGSETVRPWKGPCQGRRQIIWAPPTYED